MGVTFFSPEVSSDHIQMNLLMLGYLFTSVMIDPAYQHILFLAPSFILGNLSPTAGAQMFYLKLHDNENNKKSCGNSAEMQKSSPFLTHGTNCDIHPRAQVLHEDPRGHAVKMFWNPTSVIAQLEGLQYQLGTVQK